MARRRCKFCFQPLPSPSVLARMLRRDLKDADELEQRAIDCDGAGSWPAAFAHLERVVEDVIAMLEGFCKPEHQVKYELRAAAAEVFHE